MKSFDIAKIAVSAVFTLFVFSYLFINIGEQRYDIAYGLDIIHAPESLSEFGEKSAEVEAALNTYSYHRELLINLHSLIQTALGKEESGNFDVVRSGDGSLNYGDFYHEIPAELEEYALRVRRLRDYAAENGAAVVFINVPSAHVDGLHTYSEGLVYQNQSVFMDAMLFFLQGLEVDCFDMRTALKSSGLEPEKYRFKTDIHWTADAAFEGFCALVDMLESKYGESIDPDGFYTDIENYERSLYRGSMLGALGMRTGIPFAEKEDFTLITPNFPTSFTHERSDGDAAESVSGDFDEAIIDSDYFQTENLYMSYLGGLAPFRHIVNNNNEDGLKILLLCDSFSLPLASFLSLTSSEVDMIFTGSREVFGYEIDIDGYIAENAGEYDYIFVEQNPGSFNDSGFSFFAD